MSSASWVLPRIVASCFPLFGFPIASGWAEKQHMGTLREYAATTPSDVQQFASFDEEARLLENKGEMAKILPSRNSAWFNTTADKIEALVAKAEKAAGAHPGREFLSTVVDLNILANLARYHAWRIPAAVSYRLYENTRDPGALDSAIKHEQHAIEAWTRIVNAAGDVYADTLMMGPRKRTLVGSWKQELADLHTEMSSLLELRKNYVRPDTARTAPDYISRQGINYPALFQFAHTPPATAFAGQPLTLHATVTAAAGLKWVRLLYRDVDQYKEFKTIEMKATDGKGSFEAVIPAADISGKWDLMYLVEVMDQKQQGTIFPDLDKETPYLVVRVTR